MTGRQGRLGKTAVRAALALATAAAVALSVPTVAASPETDAYDAITAAWEAAGGDTSTLGAPQGEVHPAGAGFVQDFAGGKMFYTPETGARSLYGPVLDKYLSLGGPVDSDLGFPNINEVPGLASPDSRVATFSAADNPVIYWTPEHGAYVVRGAINAGWDKLGSSMGPLGVPVGDESYSGNVITQKFSGGQLSWDSQARSFTSVPPDLAGQLADVQVTDDPAAAIGRAWRATGGAAGTLGAKRGELYQVGDGLGQDFAEGKIFFSPATGAGAVAGEVLAKYESLGGPAGSDLGFPVGSETDGGPPDSRMSTFSADDQPVIFFAPETGAFVVRGAMKAAWDKLDGASGALGAPVGDQAVEGDQVSQKFTGGTVRWDRTSNTFSTEPPNLAKLLAGLQVPGMSEPSSVSTAGAADGPHWQWWWLAPAVVVLALLGAVPWALRRRQRHPAGAMSTRAGELSGLDADDEWSMAHSESDTTVRLPSRYSDLLSGAEAESDAAEHPEHPAPGPQWSEYLAGADDAEGFEEPAGSAAPEVPTGSDGSDGLDDADDIDTAPTRIPSETELGRGRHAVADHTDYAPDAGGVGYDHAADDVRIARDTHDAQFGAAGSTRDADSQPMMHLPLEDPYRAPEGYPVKANVGSGLYYTVDSELYDDTLAEIWFADEESARLNGFIKAR